MITNPTITEQTLDVWGGRLSITVKVAGAGAPLLYLHPAGGLTWDPFLTHLASRYTVYAPEFPGTSEGNPYAIHAIDALGDMVLVYEELIRKLGLEHPVVVGQSFGGMLAAEIASAFPALPEKLILLDPIGLWNEANPTANWVATPPNQLPALLFHDPSSSAAQAMLAPSDDIAQQQAGAAAIVWAFGCTGKFVWPIPDRGLWHRLHRLSAPTLIVWGRNDKLVSVDYAEHFHKLVTDSTVTIIDDCGHIPQVEKLDETIETVDKFLL
ncbi:alpha/beta hydrolase [Rhodococcus sp. WS3]|uniref:alpha/beta fold hydrolase n=1 Tax=unclassified Rhodococcus (in: high G+C Gram-positive bacteria) TaxID=192944 RepID=UPI0005D441A0|nr:MULTISPECIES: alpha/beta hydrolase [unclassified Rhodococcus (in: high G+C Gram-positive bacteria)]KJF19216.1 2-hydroxy-6-oxo-6-phenylhexa-2,4-dienoate hydrolase [Rhodococcus sp. AD45]ROZ42805.1 alpha/beta hydrolase [Rhodococcus sp. WS3]RZL20876.1 MAG: alpha/beta hydrolase [Rhodococcus sp. (in: high G+C Gram-positive bacteria)]